MKRELDIVVLSDVHLGTYGCHANELLNYLKSIKPGMLILNGDFIDMWQFRKRYFPKEHIQVIQQVLKMASRGVKVYYITGNHDDALRRYSDFSAGNILLRDKLILQLAGKTCWIFHGDIFDLFIRYSPYVSRLGGKGYDLLIWLNRSINKLRRAMGLPRMSFAKKVKYRVKEAIKFISDFEKTALQLAAEEDYDYVICGHIHRPIMRTEEVQGKKVTYLNSGDWVENLTALEYNWGRWSIYEYDETDYQYVNPRLFVKEVLEEDEDAVATRPSMEEVYLEIVSKPVSGKQASS
ncbi:MAG: UDP-2,3-diacylglucosamine diphosphatase [Phaeodactylibacter sp.]|nr:UDP-2,3-diacylglucosamine diphosphatase [Phaeodactylibacter sp.]MCB9264944.1 UDP-2,3-diacylglucosamine diphosphatase [Lewinellaceae bacterium]MCB9291024.1 UDP-2,3-diacylglucosamine diphosphatase [Lewinellaceae bacterium]